MMKEEFREAKMPYKMGCFSWPQVSSVKVKLAVTIRLGYFPQDWLVLGRVAELPSRYVKQN